MRVATPDGDPLWLDLDDHGEADRQRLRVDLEVHAAHHADGDPTQHDGRARLEPGDRTLEVEQRWELLRVLRLLDAFVGRIEWKFRSLCAWLGCRGVDRRVEGNTTLDDRRERLRAHLQSARPDGEIDAA